MKKVLLLLFPFAFLFGCATAGDPSDSDYLRKSYGIPTDYRETEDEMTGVKRIISPGIILYNASVGWNNTGMWWGIEEKDGERSAVLIVQARLSSWSFFEAIYIKIGEEVMHFSEDKVNLQYERDVISGGDVREFLVATMDLDTMRKIIQAESFKISIRGSKGKQDYTVPKQEIWESLVDK